MNYDLWSNSFKDENIAVDVTLTNNLVLSDNNYENVKTPIKSDSSVTGLKIDPVEVAVDTTAAVPKILSRWKQTEIPVTTFKKGRDQMKITEWGPYDNRYPIAFLNNIDSNDVYHFSILGPNGTWSIRNYKDLRHITSMEGTFPAEISAQKTGNDVQLELEYNGGTFVGRFGKKQAAGKHIFAFRDYQPEINWTVNWYQWDAAHDPNKNYEQFRSVFSGEPVKTEQAKKIDYTWWGNIGKNLPADSFAIVATGNVEVEKGRYRLSVTADDIVKVFVDNKLIIDFWDVSKYKNDEDTYHEAFIDLNGNHQVRIEHAENSGYATLIFKITPVTN
jgi:hypothetical protein